MRSLYKCEALWRSDTPTVAAISGTASAPQAFRGDASSHNEKSGNLASCLLVGRVLFRPLAIRHGVSPGHRGRDTPGSQKAPSAKRCIKTELFSCSSEHHCFIRKHRAPNSALQLHQLALRRTTVRPIRKHRAPQGAFRRGPSDLAGLLSNSEKAPSTKRCIKTFEAGVSTNSTTLGQKALSTKRCIKTRLAWTHECLCGCVRKRRAP